MEFECRTVPLTAPVLNEKGAVEPMCNTCCQIDCSNPIKKMSVSVFGKKEKWNVFVVGSRAYQVVQCAGYID